MERRRLTEGFVRTTTGGSGSNRDRGDPIDIDSYNNVEKKRFKKGGGGNKKAGMTCYACSKPGHKKADCRFKNKVQRKQYNAL